MKRRSLFVALLNGYFQTPIAELEYTLREYQYVFPEAGAYLDDELTIEEFKQELGYILDHSPEMLFQIQETTRIRDSMRGNA